MTCTFGNFSNFRIHRTTCGSLMARRSPWTSCTTARSFRSMEGISISSGASCWVLRAGCSCQVPCAGCWVRCRVLVPGACAGCLCLVLRCALLVKVRCAQCGHESRVDQTGRVALIIHLPILAELVHRGDGFVVVARVVAVVGGLLCARVRDQLVVLSAVRFLKFLHAWRVDRARWIRKRRQRGP